ASLGAVDGLEAMGLRGVVAYGAEDAVDAQPVATVLAEHQALAERCAACDLVGFRLGVGTVLGQSDELLAASAAEAKRNSWGVHTHLAEVKEEVVEARLRWGATTVGRAAEVGLLEVPLLAAHCIWVGQGEIADLARAGVTVVHNPVANMILGSGVCPVPALRQAGIPVGIGTDGAASNDSQNMLEAVKSAALLQKVARLDPRALTAGDVLAMATVEGARALGLERRIGSLEPGKRADVVRLRGDRPGLANVHDPRQQVVYCTSPSDVADVWVDGARRVADGRLVDHDLAGWSRRVGPWPPSWSPLPGSAGAPAWPERSVAAEGAAGQGAAAGLGQQHVVGGDHDQLAAGQRPGDLAPDRPAGGVPVGRPELLQGRLFGGVEAVGGGWPWSGLAGRRTLARPEPEGGCCAQPSGDRPEEPRGVVGICH
ncbi:MAG TPA: amidohydrolase family protein, partial [Actinomycetota bacterium]